jgi:hypothetical protein
VLVEFLAPGGSFGCPLKLKAAGLERFLQTLRSPPLEDFSRNPVGKKGGAIQVKRQGTRAKQSRHSAIVSSVECRAQEQGTMKCAVYERFKERKALPRLCYLMRTWRRVLCFWNVSSLDQMKKIFFPADTDRYRCLFHADAYLVVSLTLSLHSHKMFNTPERKVSERFRFQWPSEGNLGTIDGAKAIQVPDRLDDAGHDQQSGQQ